MSNPATENNVGREYSGYLDNEPQPPQSFSVLPPDQQMQASTEVEPPEQTLSKLADDLSEVLEESGNLTVGVLRSLVGLLPTKDMRPSASDPELRTDVSRLAELIAALSSGEQKTIETACNINEAETTSAPAEARVYQAEPERTEYRLPPSSRPTIENEIPASGVPQPTVLILPEAQVTTHPTIKTPELQTQPIQIGQVIEKALNFFSILKLKVSSVTSVARTDNGWRVAAELVERKAVPDTSDLLGIYELSLDAAGNVLNYERTRMRRRSDLCK